MPVDELYFMTTQTQFEEKKLQKRWSEEDIDVAGELCDLDGGILGRLIKQQQNLSELPRQYHPEHREMCDTVLRIMEDLLDDTDWWDVEKNWERIQAECPGSKEMVPGVEVEKLKNAYDAFKAIVGKPANEVPKPPAGFDSPAP